VEIIPTIEQEVSKIQPLELEPQTELMEEVKITKMGMHVKTIKPKVGTKPLVIIHAEITKTIIEDISV
jgi:hypothetical protein